MSVSISITHRDGLARGGILSTPHGEVETPNFMFVSTQGSPKGVTLQQVLEHGAQIMLVNAFHMAWRPGEQRVAQFGGLHKFVSWQRPILTDSGGFQIFSLPGLRKITDEGAAFASPLNGDVRMFSPELVVDIACALKPDIAMVLDECPAYPCSEKELCGSVTRSIHWAERSYQHWKARAPEGVSMFGIVQGGFSEAERLRSLEGTCAIPFPGFALGGFCVGEPLEKTHATISFTAPKLAADKPRYLMGMGKPADILLAVQHGIDIFDCTIPTRNGRNGLAFTSQGPIRIPNARHAENLGPLDPNCECYTCRNFSRAFLRHLFLAREMNGAILMSLHNLAFYFRLMKDIREAIRAGRLVEFSRQFMASWDNGDEPDAQETE